ncbi:hypothetical protein ACHAWX_000638 [Stephanocyclus meneghinianus]
MKTSIILPLLLTLLKHAPVQSAASIDPIVICGTSGANKICATKEFYTPSPTGVELPNGTDVVEYLGGYSTVFNYYDGVENGTDTLDWSPPHYEGSIEVVLNDDGTCKTSVNINGTEAECASCTHCGFDDYDEFHYEMDCTNVEINPNMVFTRTLTCDDSILPIFFPLNNDDNDEDGDVDAAPTDEATLDAAAPSSATILRDSLFLAMITVTSLINYSV